MRTIKFVTVLDAVSRMMGWGDIADQDDIRRGKIIEFVNVRLSQGWEFDWWPEFMRVEGRAYRLGWDATRPYQADNEIYYSGDGNYYTCLVGNAGQQPDVSPTYWEVLELADKYIPWEQDDQVPIGHVKDVFTRNPLTSQAPGKLNFELSNNGVQLSPIAPSYAYIQYRVRVSEFSNTNWSASATWEIGDIAYYDVNGECYKAILTDAGQQWTLVEFPYILKNFLIRSVYSDMLRDDGQDDKAGSEEDAAWGHLLDLQDVELGAQKQSGRASAETY